MQRVELPGSDGSPKKAVVISYIPLLTGEPGRVLSVGNQEFKGLMFEADRCPSGRRRQAYTRHEPGWGFLTLLKSHVNFVLNQSAPEDNRQVVL